MTPLRVVALVGSLRATSSTAALARAVARAAPGQVAVDLTVDLGALPHFSPDLDMAPLPPAVAALRAANGDADALLVTSPEYAHGMPGTLKNALDWLVGLSTIYRKPVVVVCAGTTGGAFTIEALVRTLSYQGALTVGTLGVEGIRTKLGVDGAVTDPTLLNDLAALAGRLVDGVRADDPERFRLVAPIVRPHGIDPARFGLVT